MLATSVVIRVTSPGAENLSMLANEKVCTLAKMSVRRFFAKPALAVAENLPASIPKTSDAAAMTKSNPPQKRMLRMEPSTSISSSILTM